MSENGGNKTRFARRPIRLAGLPFFKCDEMSLRSVSTDQ